MQFHQLKPQHANKNGRRIGRGGKRGTYSGRGIKGQGARAGAKMRPQERELIKKIPKLRGYKFKSFRQKFAVVNLRDVNNVFSEGEMVSPRALLEKKLVSKRKGRMPRIKILGAGDVKKKFRFENVRLSHAVQKKQNARI